MYKIYDADVRLIEHISERLGCSAYEITMKTRRNEICERRQVLMWWLRDREMWQYQRIGMALGYHHTSIIHSVVKVRNMLHLRDKKIVELVKMLES